MFSMPDGEAVDAEMDLGVNQTQFPFECGCISYSKPRAKSPCAHRLVHGGMVVGWVAEAEGKTRFVAGAAAKARILELADEHDLRPCGVSWSLTRFAEVARNIPEAFADPTEVASLLAQGGAALAVETKDLSLLIDDVITADQVMGAVAFEDGMVIHAAGDLPMVAESLAEMGQSRLSSVMEMAADLGQETPVTADLRLEDGRMVLAEAGQAGLALWCRHAADASALLSNAAARLASSTAPPLGEGGPLPEGQIIKESKAGVDQVISALRMAHDEGLTGHLESMSTEESISILVVSGIPVGLAHTVGEPLEDSVTAMTSSSRRLRLHRLPRAARLGAMQSTAEDFTLARLVDALVHCRTRSDDRRKLIQGRLDGILGFELGLEAMISGRAHWTLVEDEATPMAKLMPVGRRKVLSPSDAKTTARIEELEKGRIALEREKGRIERELTEARANLADVQNANRDLDATLSEVRDERSALHREIDDLTAMRRAAETTAEEAEGMADRLSKRVAELEHQVAGRAEELAGALGELESREALLADLRELAEQEASTKAELAAAEARLDEVRGALDHDERLQRVLTEQVSTSRDRHRKATAELDETKRRIDNQRTELADLEAEAHAHRRLMEDERGRLGEMERKSTILQSELREMMEERRALLRELGDYDARKAQSETELRMLLEQAEDLTETHEQALVDIQEADRIRARLSEEPLAQALLGDDRGLSSLEPVLDRMASARSRGYSIVLLDRAVERGLAIIQHSVDEVSQTPRFLLSNEVMDLLERQAPETAGTVRGLTRWSVQSRLEHKLAETVQQVVIDMERLLDEYETSVTMLSQLQEVLKGLADLGLPAEDIRPLERFAHMPEALPHLSTEVRRLIQRSLDEIYLDADRRSAGEAVGLAETVEVLEQLLRRLDIAGLSGDEAKGDLWTFQRSGSLPFEASGLARHERPDISKEAVLHMNPVEVEAMPEETVSALAAESPAIAEVIPSAPTAVPTPESAAAPASNSTWEPIEAAEENDGVDISMRISAGLAPADAPGHVDEADILSRVDIALSAVDAAADDRESTINGVPAPAAPEARDALDEIERELRDLDI